MEPTMSEFIAGPSDSPDAPSNWRNITPGEVRALPSRLDAIIEATHSHKLERMSGP
jgi:hypothetical protein